MSPTGLKPSRGGEGQNVALALVIVFFAIMLLELDERFPQRTFPGQDQIVLLFNKMHPVAPQKRSSSSFEQEVADTSRSQGLAGFSAESGIANVQNVATTVEMPHSVKCGVASHLTHPAEK
jgi:hypothetical protein